MRSRPCCFPAMRVVRIEYNTSTLLHTYIALAGGRQTGTPGTLISLSSLSREVPHHGQKHSDEPGHPFRPVYCINTMTIAGTTRRAPPPQPPNPGQEIGSIEPAHALRRGPMNSSPGTTTHRRRSLDRSFAAVITRAKVRSKRKQRMPRREGNLPGFPYLGYVHAQDGREKARFMPPSRPWLMMSMNHRNVVCCFLLCKSSVATQGQAGHTASIQLT